MKSMRILAAVASAAAVAAVTVHPVFNLNIVMMGNSRVVATLTNEGPEPVVVLNVDGLLSEYPVQKVHITSEGMYTYNTQSVLLPT